MMPRIRLLADEVGQQDVIVGARLASSSGSFRGGGSFKSAAGSSSSNANRLW